MGIPVQGEVERFAEEWLRRRGCNDLWEAWERSFSLGDLQRWYDDAYTVATELTRSRPWRAFVLYGSILSDYRFVYWDVVDGNRKWKRET
jgi:hypothetical protein